MTEKIAVESPSSDKDVENERCISDLLHNANSKDYCNEKGFKQKLIDLLYKRGYYKSNESIFLLERN